VREANKVKQVSKKSTKIAFIIPFLFMSFSAQAALVKKTVEYKAGGNTFEGYFAYDDSTKETRPGILVAPDWLGVTDKARERADQLAQLGYAALVVDVYGKGTRPKNPDEAGKLAGQYKKDRATLRSRMQEGLKVLREQPQVDKSRVAAVGYCFGGTAALELARTGADIRDVVTFHGGLDSPNPDDGKKIKARILALHGADDPFVPAADLTAFENEMRKAHVDWTLIKYGNAVHSFTDKTAGSDNSKGAAYNESADKRSWREMQEFLKSSL
jgi:dienelactone hydrolase